MEAQPTPKARLVTAALTGVWQKGSEVLAQLQFAEELWTDAGAPREAWVRYAFGNTSGEVEVQLILLNKTATRLPEATYFTFRPTGSSNGTWQHNVLGEWSSPLDVADGGSRGLHFTTEEGVKLIMGGGEGLQVRSIDVGLLRWDEPMPFPTPLHRDVNLAQGASFCLHNNIWNTNYPNWMPFDEVGKNMKTRFQISLST